MIRDAGPKSKQCDSKGIVILNGRNSIKGLNSTGVRHGLPKSILITCDAQSRLPYLLPKGGTRIPRRPPGSTKRNPHRRGQGGPVNAGPPCTIGATDHKPRPRASGPSRYALSGVKVEQPHKKSIPGQCFNCQMYGHSSKTVSNARCVKCLGDHGTAACTRNTQTGRPPVSFVNHPPHGQLLRLSRAPKRNTTQKIKLLSARSRAYARAVTQNYRTRKRRQAPYGPATPNKN
ncbi:hypothetical protein EVAR_43293_1 [Eumeta japonica]|uniref:Nucleic-acid-binding protein from transposon X-element n=1 Tax=Eumeta variegata TaxID=151549 RepID=A0A4C1X1X4_EUMVA|nr:hypothetical protein EVAR_43293_1 [Eumeta japonica]